MVTIGSFSQGSRAPEYQKYTNVKESFLKVAWENILQLRVTAFLGSHMVEGGASEVREAVLKEMPDPSTAMQRAFAHSFLARSWEDVLEYSLDVNAYLEKLFLTLFRPVRSELRRTSLFRRPVLGWIGADFRVQIRIF